MSDKVETSPESIENEIPVEQVEQPIEEPKVEEPKVEPVKQTNEVAEALKEIRDSLKQTPEQPQLTPEQIREQIKERTGMTDAQIDFYEQSTRQAVTSAVAPLQEKLAWSELRQEFGEIDADIKEEMEKELKQYPPNMRGDSVLLRKVYKLAAYDKLAANKSKQPAAPVMEDNVISRRIVSPSIGSSQSLSSNAGQSTVRLSDDEKKMVQRYFGGDVKSYMKHKNTDRIEELKA